MNRKAMLDGCPEDFKERLVEIVDHLEGRVNEIEGLLSIESLDDLAQIVEAGEVVRSLASDLY